MDVQVSPAFESIHSLRNRVGRNRQPEEHLYRSVFDGLPSLSRPTRRRGLARRLRLSRPSSSAR
jgi:hypothetical protein